MPHTEAEFLDVIGKKVSIDSFPPALPWDYQGDHLSLSHHTNVPHTEAEFLDVIETKVSLDSYPPPVIV